MTTCEHLLASLERSTGAVYRVIIVYQRGNCRAKSGSDGGYLGMGASVLTETILKK